MRTLKILKKRGLIVATIIGVIMGCSGDDNSTVNIENNASFEVSLDENGNSVHFINTSTNASTYEWSFGDGVISTEKNPIHTYDVAGTYTVTLTVNTLGKTSIATQQVTTNTDSELPCIVETGENFDPVLGPLWFSYKDGETLFNEFGGMETAIVDNIVKDDINKSCKVQKYVKTSSAQSWSGVGYVVTNAIKPSEQPSVIKLKVFGESRIANVTIRLEYNPFPDVDPAVEVVVPMTKIGEWEELAFDFSDHSDKTFTSIIIYFDKGENFDNAIFYFDDFMQSES
ncbi:uncharacterized protein UJ101_00417 [Flavobacteriaceae bacterium UJ101]|nr:uncharacterized protein UJ101_00417 [Flavobacteriaceae bacterium UJ101]